MKQLTLDPIQARQIILHASGLSKRGQFGKGQEAAFRVIDHLGFVQIDTNFVVERAHHHTLYSRIADYRQDWLDQLAADDRVFEYLTFASGYIPMEDYRYFLPVKAGFLARENEMPRPEANLMHRILDQITRDGPLMARDFENDRVGASSGWWDWRPSKKALERLYFDGRLMTTHRKDFQKIFDLPVNKVPGETDTTMPTPEEYARYVIRRSLQALGIAYSKDIVWRTRFLKDTLVKTELEKMVGEGEIIPVKIDGLKSSPLYLSAAYKGRKIALSGDMFILSPFDILNVLRHRLRDFFSFDYQVECFVPEPKRKYGYFSLPVLVGERFIARMDAKTDRKQGVLHVLNLHFEKGKFSEEEAGRFRDEIGRFARFNRCGEVKLHKSNNMRLAKGVVRLG